MILGSGRYTSNVLVGQCGINMFLQQSIQSRHYYQHLIISPEQLGMFNGHLT
jgi:hypothetical protein